MNRDTEPMIDIAATQRTARELRARAVGQAARALLRALVRYGLRPMADVLRRGPDASALSRMDERMLRDVGLTRGSIHFAPGASLTPANSNDPRDRTDVA